MQRLRTIPLLLVLAVAAIGMNPAAAGELDRKACASGGVLTTGEKLHTTGPGVTTPFSISFGGGAECPQLNGTLTRSTCTTWTGTGASYVGSFGLNGEGATLVLTGEMQGVIQLDYTVLCNGGGSSFFRGTGSLTWTQ
ncbi:MAG: hypothetical protein M3394_08395 [Actinomycetota bacterium]|nr:hypothetical protein [Actinomycetota bacterium]